MDKFSSLTVVSSSIPLRSKTDPTASAVRPTSLPSPPDLASTLASARRPVSIEQPGLAALDAALRNGLSNPFAKAVELISRTKGRVIITGVGKSGHIGYKVASTLASTGTPAFFVHPVEANHGDLGMIARD